MENFPNPKGLLTISDVARLTGLSIRTIRRATQANEIPTVRVLSRNYIPASAITKLLAGIPIGPPGEDVIGGRAGEVSMVA